MKRILKNLLAASLVTFTSAAWAAPSNNVTVENGQFMLNGEPYRYVGTNYWYGAILGSPGKGGDRERLKKDLDQLQSMGIDNLRILVGGDGDRTRDFHIEPNLQTAPGVYDQDLLEGLDYLLLELEKRNMRAVLYLTNSWEWSGGFGTYLEWTGHGEAPLPVTDGYKTFTDYVRNFMTDDKAKEMYANHVRNIVGRTNSLNGKPYSESPAIMSWQIANEPRCFDKANKGLFEEWLVSSGNLIKSIDPNHLVSTGSEGYFGCEVDADLWARIHNSDAIDYANIHIWPYNWRWVKSETLMDEIDSAYKYTDDYIATHRALTKKPLVIEEFGYPRDAMGQAPGSPVAARDLYYSHLFNAMTKDDSINGLNFWGWGGDLIPPHKVWQPGDPFTGDPAQEDQGLYSVFAADKSTVKLIKDVNKKLKKQQQKQKKQKK